MAFRYRAILPILGGNQLWFLKVFFAAFRILQTSGVKQYSLIELVAQEFLDLPIVILYSLPDIPDAISCLTCGPDHDLASQVAMLA